MGETKPKEVVNRNVAIALGIVCIILGAFLAGAIVYFSHIVNDKNSTIEEKDSVIADLNDTINLQKYTVWVNNETVTQEAGNYTSWTFTASVAVAGYIEVSMMPAKNKTYAEMLNNAYVEVICNASVPAGFEMNGVWYYVPTASAYSYYYYNSDIRVNLSSSGHINVFPVLPWTIPHGRFNDGTSIVEIRVGNTNTVDNATETVLVTYYY